MKIVKKQKVRRTLNNSECHFIKIKTMDGVITYAPKVDIRYVSVLRFFNNPDPAKQTLKDTCYRLNYVTVQGESVIDKTPYKTMSQAEKAADMIVKSLPAPQPITTITQEVLPESYDYQQPVSEIPQAGPNPIGFVNSDIDH